MLFNKVLENHSDDRLAPWPQSLAKGFCRGSSRKAAIALTTFLALLSLPIAKATAQTNQSSSVGTNLIEVTYYTTEQPFLNIIKTGWMWAGTVTNGTRYDATQNVFQLNSNGYPISMSGTGPAAGQMFSEIDTLVLRELGSSLYPAGNYVFLYDGTGSFGFQFDVGSVVSSVPGRIVINVPSPTVAGIKILFTSTGSGTNYAKNFRIRL